MADVPEVLLDTLENLEENDFNYFLQHLNNDVEDFRDVPKTQLKKTQINHIVNKMIETYDHSRAVDITLVILKKINQQQLAEKLSTSLQESKSDQTDPVQSPVPQSPEQIFTAQNGGSITAPYLHGSIFNGPVHFNIISDSEHQGGDRHRLLTGETVSPSSTVTQNEDSSDLTGGNLCEIKRMLKRNFVAKFEKLYEGTLLEGVNVPLRQIYTELYVSDSCTGGVNTDHEVRQVEAFYPKVDERPIEFCNIFKGHSDLTAHGTKVLTMGIAGVGKTACVHKFILDWAENICSHDLDFILFLPFRELNLIKDEQYSLWELLLYFHHELQDGDVMEILNENCRMVFIMDGLDENRIPLDFGQKKVSNVTEKTTLDKLIVNLMKGEILPSALIWITSRPAAAKQIPRKYFDHVTEIRGFNNPQKEEYFRKRIRDKEQARRIISHIKTVRSLHILCHIPVFCRISASVLQEMFKDVKHLENAPTTLTEMYIRFLLFQTVKRHEKLENTVPPFETRRVGLDVILKLGKLAFHQLQKGQLLFYENDLKECGIDVDEASVYSGVCTQIFKRDEKIFSFVHLSFQEFLAAVFVFLTFSPKSNPLLQTKLEKIKWKVKHTPLDLFTIAVNKALKSDEGHLDLFLRFLLGISLKSNQRLLKSLQPEMEFKEKSLMDTVDYIKKKIRKANSTEKRLNLFHCLSELKDNSLTSEIQNYLNSGDLSTQTLSSTQWSALVFVLLMSEEIQEMFELKKYRPSDEGLKRLLPVVKNTRRALLVHCNLTTESCKRLASVLQSSDSHLKELDLSTNDLGDSGVKILSGGLISSHCKLEILRLSGCLVTEDGCSCLAAALSSNTSHLKELDLAYNHPGDTGVMLLSAKLNDPNCSLERLSVDHAGTIRIKPALKKYACELTLDPNTAHTFLSLSVGNRKVTCMRTRQPYQKHPDRFNDFPQVMCKESLTGRCYWEVEWRGRAYVAVTYKDISKNGDSDDCVFGHNQRSWSLYCSNNSYSVWHNKKETILPDPPSRSNRVGVYLDWPAGTLSYYTVSPNSFTLSHLHTFHSTFTAPVHAGFMVRVHDSSVSVCPIEEAVES